jgi:hypothetical protein
VRPAQGFHGADQGIETVVLINIVDESDHVLSCMNSS